jgi:hypothetical protein
MSGSFFLIEPFLILLIISAFKEQFLFFGFIFLGYGLEASYKPISRFGFASMKISILCWQLKTLFIRCLQVKEFQICAFDFYS